MRRFIFFLLTLALFSGFSNTANATPLTNSGEYMFTVTGNDPSSPTADLSTLESSIQDWFFNEKGISLIVDLEFYAKADAPSIATTEGSGDLVLTYESDNQSGTWETAEPIDFYSVKAGNQYALYWVDGGATSGTWSTEDLGVGRNNNQPTISHFSTWKYTDEPAPVPEPSTMILLGCGLVGIAGLGRRKLRN